MKYRSVTLVGFLAATFGAIAVDADPLVIKDAVMARADFPIVTAAGAAEILVDQTDADVVHIAADLLAGDIERVSGVRPHVVKASVVGRRDRPVIVIGTLGHSALIDELVARGKLDVNAIRGKWESYLIASVENAAPDMPPALVIAGSDRRGTAYGAFEVSQAIGVSPWAWWAEVTPAHQATLVLAGALTQGPPSVKYRGIFLNDEDWGLRPWAAKTFEPEAGNIGPKTYAKIFELLLRLKANFIWPAMHPGTTPFNFIPENKVVADRYAIVMGSSHAEPMLRNNVGEWPHDQAAAWNPVTNLPAILQYWEERVSENGRYDNVYTMGMRGVHDSGMPGGGTINEKRDRRGIL